MRFSKNVADLEPSPTLALRAQARRLRTEGRSIADLSAGEPSFPTPQVAVEAALEAVRDRRATGYPPTQGILQLREAVAGYLSETTTHAEADPACVLVSAGVKQALFNIAYCLFEKGDEVLVPAPYWPTYMAVVSLAGATPVPVGTRWEHHFQIDPEMLERRRTERTRGLVLNSPANPSGHVYDLETLEAVCGWAARHGIWILSDEIYRRLYYRGDAAPSVLDVADRSDEVVHFDGVSKMFSMPGWRIGFAMGPGDLVRKASSLQGQTTSGAAGPSQFAAAGILSSPEREEIVRSFRSILERRRRAAVEGLAGLSGLETPEPDGALYVFPRLSTGSSSAETARRLLLEAGVACVPGDAFGAPGFLRLNYSVDDAELAEALTRIRKFLGTP